MSTSTVQVHRVWIKATPQAVWDAITSPEWNAQYGYGCPSEYDLRPGGTYRVLANEAMTQHGAPPVIIDGEVLESDPPNKLVQTWRANFSPDLTAEGFTRLTWEITEEYGAVRLTVTHELEGAPMAAAQVAGDIPGAGGGWTYIISDLKTLLETGKTFAS
ncbi:SRPBCC domain-containing protein [Umezawaea tangerina]|uniref:SRPBCC domain-containing protein n=1 Tax=Umezawaea tangerina TaxID=84725 RepID=UPI000D04B7A5|nr:SRPBCC domain-containing protein [Umezawaea tangerina]